MITGAAGGLGQGLVAEFVAQGWRVVAGWHRQPPALAGDSIWPIPLDVTDGARAPAVVQEVIAKWERMDALINNAGVIADGPHWQLAEADWDRVLAANLKGAFHLCRAVLPVLVRQRGGQIVNLASYSARQGTRGQANYAAAKAALIGLTQSLAREVGPQNVRVNAVLPGFLATPMTVSLPPAVLQSAAEANALERFNTVAEVARFIAFLATLENVSGQVFQLDSRIGRWT